MSELRDRINTAKEYFEAQKQKVEIERFVASRLQTHLSQSVRGESGLYRWIYGADDIHNMKQQEVYCFWIHFDQKTISCRVVYAEMLRDGRIQITNEFDFLKIPADMLKFFDQRGFTIYHKNAEATSQTITDWFDEE